MKPAPPTPDTAPRASAPDAPRLNEFFDEQAGTPADPAAHDYDFFGGSHFTGAA